MTTPRAIKALAKWLPFRERKGKPTTVVLHASAGGSALGAIAWLAKIKLSYHYMIDKDGTTYKCVPASKVALHAGISSGPSGSGVNEYSIGICLVGMNDGTPYTDAQYAALKALLYELEANEPTLRYITTHYAITVKQDGSYRKSDPRNLNVSKVHTTRLHWWKPAYAKGFFLA